MSYRRIDVQDVGDVAVVTFRDSRIIGDISILELDCELFRVVEVDNRKKILLNFSNVAYLSVAFLGGLIILKNKVAVHCANLKLSNLCPDVYEIFLISHLNVAFDILVDEQDALNSF